MTLTLPEYIQELSPYKPGRPIADVLSEYGLASAVKLASNENPLGPSPKAVAKIVESLGHLERYPNGGRTLRKAIAAKNGLDIEEVIVGSGSEGVLNNFMRTLLEAGDEVLTSEGTFSGFTVIAHAMGLRVTSVPLRGFGFDLEAMLGAVTPRTKVIYIANPNNPTGSCFTWPEFEAYYNQISKDILIIHDEAYVDFGLDLFEGYESTFTRRLENVLTLRTFSKSHGLAGIRIGYGSGPRELIAAMLKVKLPFEPSEPAQQAGLGALEDDEFLQRTLTLNREGRRQLQDFFTEQEIDFVPTAANFICINLGLESAALEFTSQLEQRGVIVRSCKWFGLPTCVRISIGTAAENERFINTAAEIFETIRAQSYGC